MWGWWYVVPSPAVRGTRSIREVSDSGADAGEREGGAAAAEGRAAPPGWYEVPGGQGRRCYWDGNQWTDGTQPLPATAEAAQSPPSPGWYPDPLHDGGLRYWGGAAWTKRVRGRADRATFLRLLALAVAGIAVVVGGVALAIQLPQFGNDLDRSTCSDAALYGSLWPMLLPWVLLILLAVSATTLRSRRGRGDWRVTLIVLSGWAAVALLNPLIYTCGGMANCGL